MPFDGYTLSLITKELENEITGARIEKIHQPSRDRIVLHLRKRSGPVKLMLSASSDSARIHLTTATDENPAAPPMLCMLFRKHLTGGIITGIRQNGLDRTVFLDIKATSEIGDKTEFCLCAEIMAKHSNIILINSEGIIVDAVRRVDYTKSSVRQILPGFKYETPPKQDKLDIRQIDNETVLTALKQYPQKPLSSALLSVLQGASPLVAREVAYRVFQNDLPVQCITVADAENLYQALDIYRNLLTGKTPAKPVALFRNSDSPFDFTFDEIKQYGDVVSFKEYQSFSALLDYFYFEKNRHERTQQAEQNLLKSVQNLLARAERKLEGRKTDLIECGGKDEKKMFAELIYANQYSLEKGSLFYDLNNFFDEYKPIRIKADPALSPAANAQKYYKEYNKLKNAEKMLTGLIEESENEVEYLKSVYDSLLRSDSYSAIAEIKTELINEGYIKRKKDTKGKKAKPLPPIKYVSDDGYVILVGRNNIQNELLTFKTAARDDSWFHVQKMPGSHVVVIGNGDILPERTCRQAASLAAFHSTARHSSQVPVDYTEIRELKKPKTGRTGMVIYHKYNTMWVTPGEPGKADNE
ncbi:MAG: NFACT family protein [Clostridiales bacterium]|nr:NFACT family protein [Clostridiales bacterium]